LGKMKLYELAKEIDVSSKDLLEQAKTLGIELKSHLSSISDEEAKTLKERFGKKDSKEATKKEEKKPKKEAAQKKDNPVIIRREVIIEEENKHKKKRATVGSDRPFQLILLCQSKTRSLYQI